MSAAPCIISAGALMCSPDFSGETSLVWKFAFFSACLIAIFSKGSGTSEGTLSLIMECKSEKVSKVTIPLS